MMSALLKPSAAASALHLSTEMNSIEELRVLLFLLSHTWGHSREEVARALHLSPTTAWYCLKRLTRKGHVIVSDREHVKSKSGPMAQIYSVKGAVS